jgi:hypothetical protein
MTMQTYALNPGRIEKFKGQILKHAVPVEALGRQGRQVQMPKNQSKTYVARRFLPYGATSTSANTQNHSLHIIYDASHYTSPVLIGVDDITSNELGELLVAEDKGNMQIVILSGSTIKPLLQLVGHDQSEITGLAFSPDGSRLYFSSQRGKTGRNENGVTFEISGFR